MPTPVFIKIDAEKQNVITAGACDDKSIGTAWVDKHPEELIAHEVKHIVTVPTDPQSGQPSGQRVHKAFMFTCALNSAVPLMYNALTSGEQLKKVDISWWRTADNGSQEHFFTTSLTEGTIVDINLHMPHAQDQNFSEFTQLVTVSVAYAKIDWRHEISGKDGTDTWRAPIGH